MIDSISLIAGVFASMLHVISGPDHLAAVTPLVFEKERSAWKIGLFWGLGHLSGMLLIGLLFVFLKDVLPIEKISSNSELLVGYILIGIGLWTFHRIYKRKKSHKHPHLHKDKAQYKYVHIHNHEHMHEHHHHNGQGHTHEHDKMESQSSSTSFVIGFIHGLAGVAHFLLLLPVLGFSSGFQGVQYIIGFGIGTVIAMVIYTLVLGKISQSFKNSNNKTIITAIQIVGGVFAIFIGVYWIISLS